MLNILLVEDNADHAELVQQVVGFGIQESHIEWCDSMESARKTLSGYNPDLVLLDLSLPDCDPYLTVSHITQMTDKPVIVLTSLDDKTVAIESIKDGAQDFYFKSELTEGESFVKSIKFALERCKLRDQLKLSNERLEMYAAELKRSNEELENFAHIASHDLQEPLRKIESFSKILLDKSNSELTDEDLENLGIIGDSAERMRGLIIGLLDYSRLGRSSVRKKTVNPKKIVEDVVDLISTTVLEKDAHINISLLEFEIDSDELLLHRVFLNLLTNALKFVDKDVTPKIEIGGKHDKNKAEFWIKDNGIGMKESDRERIFTIFQRLHGKSKYPGTGIGLAVCKKVIERLGGSIKVESNPEGGSIFKFTVKDHSTRQTQPKQALQTIEQPLRQ